MTWPAISARPYLGQHPGEERVHAGRRHRLAAQLGGLPGGGVQLGDEDPHGHGQDVEVAGRDAAQVGLADAADQPARHRLRRAGRRRAARLRYAQAGHAQPGRESGITMK